jgi:NADPH2:quinone reductase
MKGIVIHRTGGPEVMAWEEVPVPPLMPGTVQIRHTAIGVNFIDTYHRTGLYPLPLPAILGLEGVGVVEEVGAGVTDMRPGDRVAYPMGPGAYAEQAVLPAQSVVPLPDTVSDRTAAAIMLKGMTAWYLLRRTFPLEAGQTILFHAAAGGVGLIACQWAKELGATVIGTVGSDEKAALAAAHGCDHPIVYRRESFADRVREITGGAKLPVVYDGVGKDTFEGSLDCLAPRGMLVLFGQSSGKVPPFDPGVLASKGSLFLTRPTLQHYIARREELLAAARELFDVVGRGAVKVEVRHTYPLREAATAHRDLEARRTTGSVVLIP